MKTTTSKKTFYADIDQVRFILLNNTHKPALNVICEYCNLVYVKHPQNKWLEMRTNTPAPSPLSLVLHKAYKQIKEVQKREKATTPAD